MAISSKTDKLDLGKLGDRTPGDDIILSLKVRRRNLPALLRGVSLGRFVRIWLIKQKDGTYALACRAPRLGVRYPEPVDVQDAAVDEDPDA